MANELSIICFGEVLWDLLPTAKVAGGAPMNAAFHIQNFGVKSQLISAVGSDELGAELLEFLHQKGISTELIHLNYTFPTSTVQVTLNEKGAASYEIVQPVAWDFLYAGATQKHAVEKASLLLFGSLICRSERNLKALYSLFEKAQKTVFDVNLRQPFYSQSLIEGLLHKADIVKMNDEELEIIVKWQNIKADVKGQMTEIMRTFNIETLIVTAGKQGAFCMNEGVMYHQSSFPVEVEDTIGSGDSFLAAFLCKMLKRHSWQECLEFACATGAMVATKSGGTPQINEEMVTSFIEKR